LSYKNNVVKKPWGYEYLAYGNDHVGLWFLHIKHGHSTSMHCHPNKTTGLMLLEGEAEVSFLGNSVPLKPKDKLMIRKGLFHSTKAISKEGICLIEIETPRDKHNLVRLEDKYGRQGKPYEDSTFEATKEPACLWIENPSAGGQNIYESSNYKIIVISLDNIEGLKEIREDRNIIFLQGGILTEYGIFVAGPGDIVSGHVIRKLIDVFDNVADDTIIMIMEDLNE
jgi:mannose-6-phosphate isomerase-like protein (cupin superfamily)